MSQSRRNADVRSMWAPGPCSPQLVDQRSHRERANERSHATIESGHKDGQGRPMLPKGAIRGGQHTEHQTRRQRGPQLRTCEVSGDTTSTR